MYFPIHSLGRVFFCKKECQYTASSWDELENTPSSDLEICRSRDCPRAKPEGNLEGRGGCISQYIPPLGSVRIQYARIKLSVCFQVYSHLVIFHYPPKVDTEVLGGVVVPDVVVCVGH